MRAEERRMAGLRGETQSGVTSNTYGKVCGSSSPPGRRPGHSSLLRALRVCGRRQNRSRMRPQKITIDNLRNRDGALVSTFGGGAAERSQAQSSACAKLWRPRRRVAAPYAHVQIALMYHGALKCIASPIAAANAA